MKFNCSYSELIEIHKLVPNPKNPNSHSDEQIERLAKIIDYQGQRSPIVVSNRTGFITKGHGRLMAMTKLGWEKVAVDRQDYDSEAQEYADIVADNAIAEWSVMDKNLIYENMASFPDINIDLLGIEDFNLGDIGEIELPSLSSDGKSELEQMTFTLHNSQIETVKEAIALIKKKYKEMIPNELNDNSNGNSIAYICELFITENNS